MFVAFFLGLSLSPYFGADDVNNDKALEVPVEISLLAEQRGLFYYPRDAEYPFTGEVNAGPERGKVKDGKKEGLWIRHHDNGQVAHEGAYKNGKREGPWAFFNRQGTKDQASSITYRNGEKVSETVGAVNRSDESSAVSLLSDLLEKDGHFYYPRDAEHPFTGEVTGGPARGQIKDGKKEGLWIRRHDNNQFAHEGAYKNGKREGLWSYYYKDGQLKRKGAYNNGEAEGLWVHYYEDGQLSREGVYKNGEAEGSWVYYSNDGQLFREGEYENGTREGPWSSFYDNEQLARKGEFKNGKRNGSWSFYFENGQLAREGEFQSGQEEGHWIYYHDNGQTRAEANFNNGEHEGSWVEYAESGVKLESSDEALDVYIPAQFFLSILFEKDGLFYYPKNSRAPFTGEITVGREQGKVEDGKREGPWVFYHRNSEVESSGAFRNGEREGPWVMYWPNGQMQSNGKYIGGSEAGWWQFFHSNGQLEAEGRYHSGKAKGPWSFFYETGMRSEGISDVYIDGEEIPQADVVEDSAPLVDSRKLLTENQLSEKAQKIFSRFQSCSDEPVTFIPVLERDSQDEPFNQILIISTHLDVECLSKINRATERSVREVLHQSVGTVRENTEYDPSIEFRWKAAYVSGHRYQVASMESPDEMGCAEFCFYMTGDLIRDSGNYYYLFYPSDGGVFAKMIAEGLMSFSARNSTHSRGTVFDVNTKKVFRTPSGGIDWPKSYESYLMEGHLILRGAKAFNWEVSPESKEWGGAFWFDSKRTIAGDIIELLDIPDGRCFKRHKFDYYLRRYLILAGKEELCVEHHGG